MTAKGQLNLGRLRIAGQAAPVIWNAVHRCTLFRGYLFGKPVPLPELEAQLDLVLSQ